MGLTNAEKQRRFRERHWIVLTSPASAIVAKLLSLADKAKLRAIIDGLAAGVPEVQSEPQNRPKPPKAKLTPEERKARVAAGKAAAKRRKAEWAEYEKKNAKIVKDHERKAKLLQAKADDRAVTPEESAAFAAKAQELRDRKIKMEAPGMPPPLPEMTLEELDALKQKVKEERRAKRAATKNSVRAR